MDKVENIFKFSIANNSDNYYLYIGTELDDPKIDFFDKKDLFKETNYQGFINRNGENIIVLGNSTLEREFNELNEKFNYQESTIINPMIIR